MALLILTLAKQKKSRLVFQSLVARMSFLTKSCDKNMNPLLWSFARSAICFCYLQLLTSFPVITMMTIMRSMVMLLIIIMIIALR